MNYIPNTEADRAFMLDAIGLDSAARLYDDVPDAVRNPQLDLPPALCEMDLARAMEALAKRNANFKDHACFLGAGAYNHYVPAIVRHVTGRSEFYTAYTPYQPEISQGTLQTIFEYQSSICQLTGMDVANASMYDGATAAAEAVILAQTATRRKKTVVAPSLHPDFLAVLKTYTAHIGSELVSDWDVDGCFANGRVSAAEAARVIDRDTACVLVQQPNFFGCLEDVEALAQAAHAVGALFVVVVDPISLGLLKAPGDYGADVVVGEGQPLGSPVSFGGPYLGIFATRDKYVRQMPGRVVGQTADHDGRRGFVLTLQTREQHIRREKATSNICSNEALNALAGLAYITAMGKQGMRRVAEVSAQKAHYAAKRIAQTPGFSLAHTAPFFKEFAVRCPRPPAEINAELLKAGIIGGFDLGRFHCGLSDCTLLCVTEMNTKDEIDRLVEALARSAHSAATTGVVEAAK
jgi:glycine dehydrogenase subunit 1